MSINRWQTTKVYEALSVISLVGEKIYFEPEQHICRSLSYDGESLRENVFEIFMKSHKGFGALIILAKFR